MTGTILLTGGTGKSATPIAKKVQSRNIPVLFASRNVQSAPTGFKAVKFDWFDEATWVNPFTEEKDINTIYLVLPHFTPGVDTAALVNNFIDFSKDKGIKRFLLMSTTGTERGDASRPHGQVHAHLDTIGVDYGVLRPSGFFGNFLIVPSIKAEDELISATGKGKIGFVSEDDIADTAVELLTASRLGGAQPVIVGPELLSYDDIAAQFSQLLGRKITHRNVSAEERKADYMKRGLPEKLSGMLASMESDVFAKGVEERRYNDPGVVFGKIRFVEFVKANKAVWQK